jgi:tetratricopeptide (TPR) repeat protein
MIKQTIERLTFLIDEESYGSALELYEKSSAVLLNSGTSPSDHKALLLLGAKIYYFNQMYESSNGCLSELQRQFDEIKSNIDFIISKFQFLSTTGKSTEALEFITKATVLGWPQDEYHRLNFYVGKAYFWTGDYVEANHRFHTCYRYFLSAGDQYMLGSILHMLGYTAFQ